VTRGALGVTPQADRLVDRTGVAPLQHDVLFGADDEEGRRKSEHVEALEVDVTPVHHVERSGLGGDLIEDVDVVHLAVGNADKRGNIAVQIQKGVHLYRAFVLAKLRPRKQGETEVDGGRSERVEAVVQIHAHGILDMKWSGNADQVLREIGEDAPVVSFVGVSQGRAGNPTAESHVVEFAAHRPQARLDVAEALAVSELSEGHRQILIPARQTSVVLIAVIAGHTLLEVDVGEMSDQLRENGSADIHPPLFRRCGVRHSAHYGCFQFKSFLGRMPAILWLAKDFSDFAKYFTGQQ
jgi:hypothetical protein